MDAYKITIWDTPTTCYPATVSAESDKAWKLDGKWTPKAALQEVKYGWRFKNWWLRRQGISCHM